MAFPVFEERVSKYVKGKGVIMGRWIFKGFGCLLLICFGVVGGYLLGSSKAKTHDCAPSQPAEELHPLDRELDAAQDGLGPSSRTAGIYYDFLERWDAELNRVYREWMRKLEPEEQKTLEGLDRQPGCRPEADSFDVLAERAINNAHHVSVICSL